MLCEMNMTDARVALCLPGGGAPGVMFQIGALAALENRLDGFRGRKCDVYVGSSSGSSVAAALASGDDHDWHKLRIAVKEVRYQAESGVGGAPANPEQAELIEQCKPLQSMLGGWHDCVVQLQILDELESGAEHGPLREVIDHKRDQGLAEIQQAVISHPLFEASGNSATSARSASSSGS